MEKNNIIKLDISFWSIVKVIAVLLFIYFMFLIKDILIMMVIAFIFSASLEPVVDRIESKFKVPRWLGVLGIYASFVALIYLFFSMVVPVISEQLRMLIANKDNYIDEFESFITTLPQNYQNEINDYINKIPSDISELRLNGIYHGIFGLFSGIAGFLVIFVISFYILSLKNGMKTTLSTTIPERYRDFFIKIFGQISQKVGQWVKGQLLLSLVIGVVTFIGLWIMNIPYAAILAIIAAFTELIPLIGPFLGAIPAIIVALFINPVLALLVAAFYLLVQQLENHILVPQVMKRAVGLSPIVVIIAMLIGGKLLGIIGVILAVPIASSIDVIIKEWSNFGGKIGNK